LVLINNRPNHVLLRKGSFWPFLFLQVLVVSLIQTHFMTVNPVLIFTLATLPNLFH